MKIILEIDTKNEQQVAEASQLLLSFLTIANSEALMGQKSTNDTQPNLRPSPVKKEVKKPSVEKTETIKEPVTETVDEPVTETVDEPVKSDSTENDKVIDFAMLKEEAQNAVTRSSRADVKAAIGKFSEKIADVKPSDYNELFAMFQALGK